MESNKLILPNIDHDKIMKTALFPRRIFQKFISNRGPIRGSSVEKEEKGTAHTINKKQKEKILFEQEKKNRLQKDSENFGFKNGGKISTSDPQCR